MYDRFSVAVVVGVVMLLLLVLVFMVTIYPANPGAATPYTVGTQTTETHATP